MESENLKKFLEKLKSETKTEPDFRNNVDVKKNISEAKKAQKSAINKLADKSANIVFEDKNKRNNNSRHYKMSDGTWKTVITASPQNYYNSAEKKMRGIDNTLELRRDISDVKDFSGYENKYNSYKVRFSEDTAKSDLMSIEKDGHKVWFKLIPSSLSVIRGNGHRVGGHKFSRAMVENKAKCGVRVPECSCDIDASDKKESIVKYNELCEGTDFDYEVKSDRVKENIIINKRLNSYEYAFHVFVSGLEMRLSNDGKTVEFITLPEQGVDQKSATIFSLPAAYMYDSEGKTSYDVSYGMEKIGDSEYILEIIPNSEWINDESRKFPVVIDPTIVIDNVNDLVYKLISNDQDYSPSSDFYVSIGYKKLGKFDGRADTPETAARAFGETWLYIGLRNSDRILNGYVKSAILQLPIRGNPIVSGLEEYFEVCGITEDSSWINRSLNWSNKPVSSNEVLSVSKPELITDPETGDAVAYNIQFDLSGAFNLGYSGVVIKATDVNESYGSAERRNSISVPDENSGNNIILSISYIEADQIGGEKSEKHSCNRAGNGSIDLFTGNLLFVHDDLFLEGTQFPINIAHVYNSRYYADDIDDTYKFGAGWRLNIMQTLKELSVPTGEQNGDPNAKFYVYTDASGYKHEISTRYFKYETTGSGDSLKSYKVYSTVYDEEDTNRQSEISNDTYVLTTEGSYNVLTDDKGNKMKFDVDTGRLVSIEKPETATISTLKMTITYGSNLITVSDANGRSVYLDFSGGYLSKIRFNNEVIRSFEYQHIMYNDYLLGIVFGAAGTEDKATFDYNMNYGYLTSVADPTGYIIDYKTDYESKPIYAGYFIRTSTNEIIYDAEDMEGIISNINDMLTTIDEIDITYNYDFNGGGLLSSMYNIDNVTKVTSGSGFTTYYYFKYDGSIIAVFDDRNNIEVYHNSIKTYETDNDGYYSVKSIQTCAKIISSSLSSGYASIARDPFERFDFSYRHQLNSDYYYGLAAGWYVYAASIYGTVVSGENFNSPESADTPYVILKVTKNLKSGGTETEYVKFDSVASGNTKGQMAFLPFYVDSNVESIKIEGESFRNINFVVMESWRLLRAAEATRVTVRDKDVLKVETFHGAYGFEVESDITRRTNDTRITKTKRGGAEVKERKATYGNENYPERVTKEEDDICEVNYSYDNYGNVTREDMTEKGTSAKMFRSYSYASNDVSLNNNILSGITYEDGYNESTEYYPDGQIKRTVLPGNGQNIDYSYVGVEKLLSEIKALANSGHFVEQTANNFCYNSGYLTKMTHEGCEYRFVYDGFGRIKRIYAGGTKIVSAAYTDNGTDIDGVTGATSKDVVGYFYSSDVPLLCGIVKCSPFVKTGFIPGHMNVYASYYNKYGELIKVRNAVDVELDHVFTESEDYVTITEPNGYSDWHKVVYTVGTSVYEYGYDKITGDFVYYTEYDGENPKVKVEISGKDDYGRVNKVKYTLNGIESMEYDYGYKSVYDDTVVSVTLPGAENARVVSTVTTDGFGRITSSVLNTSTPLTEIYTYKSNGNYTTPLISEIGHKVGDALVGTERYTYDAAINISEKRDGNDTLLSSYEYDGLGRLIRENVPGGDITVFAYDKAGNITKKKKFAYTENASQSTDTLLSSVNGTEISYGYYTEGNKDRLKAYNGSGTLEYDGYGNPNKWFKHSSGGSILGYTLQWSNMSELTSISDDDTNVLHAYTYNDQGIRIKKVTNGVTHKYYVDGTRIIAESITTGNITEELRYYYDTKGICGFRYGDDKYYYVKNMQGDIVAVYDGNGTKYGEYAYDAWGKCSIIYDKDGIATKNPYRYRGYYLDKETDLYYLNSRYYDPEVGRFLSADSLGYMDPERINGLNLYAYCNNNPVMYIDPDGTLAGVIIGIIIGAIVGAITIGTIAGVTAALNGAGVWGIIGSVLLGALVGAIIGAIIGFVLVVMAPAIGAGASAIGAATGGGAAAAGVSAAGALVAGGAAVTAGAVVVGGTAIAVRAGVAIGNIVFSKGSGPRMGHNQIEAKQWNEAMRRLNITNKDLQTRIHQKLKKYEYSNTLKELLETIKEILRSFRS